MSYRSAFAVPSGHKIRLDAIDPAQTGTYASEEAAKEAIARDIGRLKSLQNLLYAENRRALLIVLQAPDAGGKDGTIKHVFSGLNPLGAEAHAFKVPTPEESAHDFLWRIHKVAPARGRVGIFNRSHYEDVVVPRVHHTVPKETVEKRYDRIVEFEKQLHQAGTQILKFFLHISKEEQLRRLEARLNDPQRHWKINESDFTERQHWDDYQKAYAVAMERTATNRAPWFIIPADHKWFRNLAVANIVVEFLDALNMQYPKPTVDLERLRREYVASP